MSFINYCRKIIWLFNFDFLSLNIIKQIMDTHINYRKDLNWIFRLLHSCETQNQLDVVEKCFKNFKIKWRDIILKNEVFKIDEFNYNLTLKEKRVVAKFR